MAASGTKISSVVAAVLLSAVTLSTFYLLRNYGPESTIQRFHTAALAGDQAELTKLVANPREERLVILIDEVRRMARFGAHPEVEDVQRGPGEVLVHIAYRSAYTVEEIYWDVKETKASNWLIDARNCTIRRSW